MEFNTRGHIAEKHGDAEGTVLGRYAAHEWARGGSCQQSVHDKINMRF